MRGGETLDGNTVLFQGFRLGVFLYRYGYACILEYFPEDGYLVGEADFS
jgi:hypothetical protein